MSIRVYILLQRFLLLATSVRNTIRHTLTLRHTYNLHGIAEINEKITQSYAKRLFTVYVVPRGVLYLPSPSYTTPILLSACHFSIPFLSTFCLEGDVSLYKNLVAINLPYRSQSISFPYRLYSQFTSQLCYATHIRYMLRYTLQVTVNIRNEQFFGSDVANPLFCFFAYVKNARLWRLFEMHFKNWVGDLFFLKIYKYFE